MPHMIREDLAHNLTYRLHGNIPFKALSIDAQNDLLQGVDAVIELYKGEPSPELTTVMRVFAHAYENAPVDISEWDDDYINEMRDVAEFIRAYAQLVNGETTSPTTLEQSQNTTNRITDIEVEDPTIVPHEMQNLNDIERQIAEYAVYIILAVQRMDDRNSINRSWAHKEATHWVNNLQTTQPELAPTEHITNTITKVITDTQNHLNNSRGFAALLTLKEWATETLTTFTAININNSEQWRQVCATYGVIIPEGRW